MTYKEFKEYCEQEGITDDATIFRGVESAGIAEELGSDDLYKHEETGDLLIEMS